MIAVQLAHTVGLSPRLEPMGVAITVVRLSIQVGRGISRGFARSQQKKQRGRLSFWLRCQRGNDGQEILHSNSRHLG